MKYLKLAKRVEFQFKKIQNKIKFAANSIYSLRKAKNNFINKNYIYFIKIGLHNKNHY